MQTSVIVCILTDHNYTWLVHMNTVSTAWLQWWMDRAQHYYHCDTKSNCFSFLL